MTGFVTKKVGRKQTVGSIFKAARTKIGWTIEQAEKETKICAKYLRALEDGDYAALPAEAYNIGYVRNYAQALKLNQEKIVALYREGRSHEHFASSKTEVLLQPRRKRDNRFFITPKLVGALLAVVVFAGLVSYIVLQLHQFSQPPPLVISNVPAEFTATSDSVTLKGRTAVGASVAVNNQPITVDQNGNFVQPIQLSPGLNRISVQATSQANKESERTISVLYNQQGLANAQETATSE